MCLVIVIHGADKFISENLKKFSNWNKHSQCYFLAECSYCIRNFNFVFSGLEVVKGKHSVWVENFGKGEMTA